MKFYAGKQTEETWRGKDLVKQLANLKVDDATNVANLLGRYLDCDFNKKNKSLLILLIWSIWRIFLKPPGVVTFSRWNNSVRCIKKNRVLLFATGHSERLIDFFQPFKSYKKAEIWISSGHKAYPKTADLFSFNFNRKRVRLTWLFDMLKIRSVPLENRLELFVHAHIQYCKYLKCRVFLEQNNIKAVFFDLDRSQINTPWVEASKALEIPNITLVHGSIEPIDNYIPVIAERVWGWGKYHQTSFKKYLKDSTLFEIVGNPKVKPKHIKAKVESKSIGFGLSPLEDDKQISLLAEYFILLVNHGFNVVVKPHPLNRRQVEELVKPMNLSILGPDVSMHHFFSIIDCLCVERSQIGTDALYIDNPIVVLDLGFKDLQNGRLLMEKAAVPLMSKAEDLLLELKKLSKDKEYIERRLESQLRFYYEMFEYAGVNSGLVYHQKLDILLDE